MPDNTYCEIPIGDFEAISRVHSWGGEKLVREMAMLFRREGPLRMQAARTATANGDAFAAEHAAHALKSSSSQMGAERMRSICEEIETLAAQGSVVGIAPLLDLLEDEFRSFTVWFDEAANILENTNSQ